MHRTTRPVACRRVRATARTPRTRSFWGIALTGCVLALGGCASSSSETPWPVEPDFERLRAESKGHPRQAHAGTEWTPREPEGDEAAEPEEEAEPASTWGGRRKAIVAAPPPLQAGTPEPSEEPDDEPPTAAPKAPPSGLGDTDDIDDDPFFQDDEED